MPGERRPSRDTYIRQFKEDRLALKNKLDTVSMLEFRVKSALLSLDTQQRKRLVHGDDERKALYKSVTSEKAHTVFSMVRAGRNGYDALNSAIAAWESTTEMAPGPDAVAQIIRDANAELDQASGRLALAVVQFGLNNL